MTSATKQKCSLDFEAIGTVWNIEFSASPAQAAKIADLVTKRIQQFDQDYSRFRDDSWVSYVSRHLGRHKVPADFTPLFELYKSIYRLTDGAVTPLIGDALERAGYDARYSLQPRKLQKIPPLADVLDFKDNTLHVKYPCVLDFGAAGKGYLVDLVSDIIEQQGIIHYIVDAGGDMRNRSPTPLLIGLEDPNVSSGVLGAVRLHNASLCASAGNRRKWGEYHHIIDPRTLKSTHDIQAVWVLARSTILADGIATCLFFTPPEQLANDFEFEYVIVDSHGRLSSSTSLPIHRV